jgi:hypothetical protein
MFTHITEGPLTKLGINNPNAPRRMMFWGKPLGLWYAPGLVWVKRIDKTKSWEITGRLESPGNVTHVLDYYTSVLENKEIPSGTSGDVGDSKAHFVYNFPLKDSFETDINKPDVSKIFKLTSSNIDAFEASLKPWLIEKFNNEFGTVKDTVYYSYLNSRHVNHFQKDFAYVVKEFLASKGIAPQLLVDNRKGHEADNDNVTLDKYLRYMVQACLIKLLTEGGVSLNDLKQRGTFQNTPHAVGLTVKEFKVAFKNAKPDAFFPDGLTKNITLCDHIRMYEYGRYLDAVMSKQWGGIDYDESLFTPELEAKYPYLPYVEVPSGCLWQPTMVMPTYVPKPIAVLGLARTQADAAELTASVPDPYKKQLYIATISNGNLVMLKKGTVGGGRRTRRKKFRKTTRKHKQ